MRITIVTEDGFVSIDGEGLDGLNLSFIPVEVHALQWYGENGEIEYQDQRGRANYNETIMSLDQFVYFPQCYELWRVAKTKKETEQIAAEAEQAALEAAMEAEQAAREAEQAALETGQINED